MAQRRKKTSKQILKGVTSGRKTLQDPKIVEPKNRRTKTTKGRDSLMEKEVFQAIDWMKEGISTEEITSRLRNTVNERTKRKYAPRFVENIVTAANQLLNLYYKDQIHNVEKLHIARYNQMIIDILNKDYEAAFPSLAARKPWMLKEKEINDLFDALQAMKQKETLLGMHRKTFRLIFNTQNNITVKSTIKQPDVDITILSLDEQVELLQIIQSASRTEEEVYGVILAQPKQEKTEDIEVELIENNNIARIEQYKKKSKNNDGSTLQDIQKVIQQRLLRAANRN